MSETPEMVERVARAMDPMAAKSADGLMARGLSRSDALGVLPLAKARAAIEAMRVPTDAMLEKGPPEPYMDAQVWSDMIDAALSTSSTA